MNEKEHLTMNEKEHFAGSCEIVNFSGETVIVMYYVLEAMQKEGRIFGVKLCSKSNVDTESIHFYLTESYEHIDFIVNYLIKYEVTPVSLTEVIDELYDMYEFAPEGA